MTSISAHKKLYLLRHAEAELFAASDQDFDRKLSSTGQNNMLQVGSIYRNTLSVDAVFCSAATRTRETWKLLNLDKGTCSFHTELYGASSDELIQFIHGIPNVFSRILLIGHNPGLSDLASYLTDEFYSLHTGQLLEIDLESSDWKMLSRGIGVEKRNIF
jgi:phosphohistidine phosphatase